MNMLSFWESQSFLKYDYIIIGAGITGLSVAASLLEKDGNASVLILEKGILPTGASTKNAGFACFGSVSELAADIRKIGEHSTKELVKMRWEGLHLMRERLGDKAIDFKQHGGYELVFKKEESIFEQVPSINRLLQSVFKEDVFEILPEDTFHEFGFKGKELSKSLIFNRFEGQIDTGKMMKALLEYVQKKGAHLFTGAEAVKLHDDSSHVEVSIKQGITFEGRKVAVCTNAFTASLFPEIEILPGRGQVLITQPIKNLKFKGTFHFDEGFYYFRNFKDRVIFGGGRNQDLLGESTTEIGVTDLILEHLKELLHSTILPDTHIHIEQVWAGIMGFGPEDKTPIVKRHTENVVLGVRLNGMGVAIGSVIGKTLADMMEE